MVNEETKRKKQLPICSQTNFLWLLFERKSKHCWVFFLNVCKHLTSFVLLMPKKLSVCIVNITTRSSQQKEETKNKNLCSFCWSQQTKLLWDCEGKKNLLFWFWEKEKTCYLAVWENKNLLFSFFRVIDLMSQKVGYAFWNPFLFQREKKKLFLFQREKKKLFLTKKKSYFCFWRGKKKVILFSERKKGSYSKKKKKWRSRPGPLLI